jgi:Putative MetA-pathway of phenol degradation
VGKRGAEDMEKPLTLANGKLAAVGVGKPEMMRRLFGLLGLVVLVVSVPAIAGPPFITDDPEPVEYRHWEVNYAFMGDLVQGGGTGALPNIDANYGALPDLQLHVQPQLAYVRTPGGSQFGIGDTEIGAKYRFVEEDDEGWRPMVSFYPLFEIPTGDRKRGLGDGVGRTFLPIWAQKTVGKWTVYGGAGYGINPGAEGKNAWFVGGVALYQVTEALQLGGEAFLQTAEAPGEKDEPGFNIGGKYDLAEDYHLLFSAGRGLANAETTNRLSAYLALQVNY